MAYRYFDTELEELREQYKKLSGNEYDPDQNLNPGMFKGELLEVVRNIKSFEVMQREWEIREEIQQKYGNPASLPPKEAAFRTEELRELKQKAELWMVNK